MGVFKDSYVEFRLMFWTIYIIALFGVWTNAPKYETLLDNVFRIIVGVALIYYFHPWRKIKFSDFHHSLVFEAGILLILSSSIKYILEQVPIVNSLIVDEHKRQNQQDFKKQLDQLRKYGAEIMDVSKYHTDMQDTDMLNSDMTQKIALL